MADFDQLLQEYHAATDAWVDAIKAEESLANADHSMVEMEQWDAADLHVQDKEAVAKEARDAYKAALRQKNYGFYADFPKVFCNDQQIPALSRFLSRRATLVPCPRAASTPPENLPGPELTAECS